jgi:cobalt/nickel transport system permease protein
LHIPDGILTAPVWAATDVAAAAGLILAARRSAAYLEQSRVPLLGVMGAFVFAAQMVNFPVPGSSSGHLLGGVLLSVLLGPANAAVVMFCVLVVQALVFQDGGVAALGANFINMGLLGSFWGWLALGVSARSGARLGQVVIFLAGWLAVLSGALLAALELAISGRVPLGPALLAMGSVHALIGLGEGALTLAALRFLKAAGLQFSAGR